jgi:flavin reductase (DIM6/NTAB) family NADH-FMN oxidoreductase RutF
MQFDPQLVAPQSIYKLLIGCVVPRPIAWVSSLSMDAIPNLAPFSFFMAVCNDPPTLAFSSGRRAGHKKDTVQNIEYTQDFVVNLVDDALAEQMNLTSGEYPPEADEFALTGLTAAPGIKVKAPRVAEAPINMECRVVQILPVGHGPHSLVLGEIVYFHIRDDLYNPTTGRIDMHNLHPVGRLAGNLYTHVHEIFEMKRPTENYAG